VRLLIEATSKDGARLLNILPKADGTNCDEILLPKKKKPADGQIRL
jgi:hypothetical protein